MKRSFLAILAFLMILILPTYCETLATGQTDLRDGNYTYTLDSDGGAAIISYDGQETELTIPDKLDGYPVKGIRNDAFRGSNLVQVILPVGLKYIGYSAFQECYALKYVEVPNGLECIAPFAFSHCENLEGFRANSDSDVSADSNMDVQQTPYENRCIGYQAFEYCEKLLFAYLPDRIAKIDNAVFFGCVNLFDVEFPSSLTSIGNMAFAACHTIEAMNFPDGLLSIDDKAFSHCYELTYVLMPSSVQSIGEDVFYRCSDKLTLSVRRGSWAEEWAKKNRINYDILE